MAVLFMLYQEQVVPRDHHFLALQGIIVQLELCSPLNTNVLWGRGVVIVVWRLKGSAGHAHMAGTV